MCTFKTWKKFGKPGKKFEKISGNHVYIIDANLEVAIFYLLFIKKLVF